MAIRQWREYTSRSGTVWLVAVLLVLIVGFSAVAPQSFPTAYNIRSLFTDAAILLILGVGSTYVIITAGIDLSVGSVLVFSGVVSAKVMNLFGGQTAGWLGIAMGLVVAITAGLLWGLINGLVIARLHVPPLIVTLGTFGMSLGLAKVITGGVDERSVPISLADTVGFGTVFGVPVLALIAVAVTTVGGLVLSLTRFGRHVRAIGSNTEAARRVGVNVTRNLVRVYGLAGGLAGLAGFLSLARFSTTTIAGHTTDNLNVIAAVVLGGTSLFGGIGTVAGTAVGVFIPAVLQNGFVIMGVQPFWQEVTVGAVLIAAVYFDQQRRAARGRPSRPARFSKRDAQTDTQVVGQEEKSSA